MSVSTHFDNLTDDEFLLAMYARGYNDNPLLEYTCKRFELAVEGLNDLQIELVEAREASTELRWKIDVLEDEIKQLKKLRRAA